MNTTRRGFIAGLAAAAASPLLGNAMAKGGRSACMVPLWEGGPYWADRNIGAQSPEDAGLYFWWGDTTGYRHDGKNWVASTGSADEPHFVFTSGRTPTWGKNGVELVREGWTGEDGVLLPERDAAHVHWGDLWRMPSSDELHGLLYNCDWSLEVRNGIKGYVVRGRGFFSLFSIFMPFPGMVTNKINLLVQSSGDYWSSSADMRDGCRADSLFISKAIRYCDSHSRHIGRVIRPVMAV